jgi:type II secretory pathway predicted ATPase ExeA
MTSTTPDIYCAHFGLRERPFLLPPDPAFLFWGRGHQSAFTVLEYGLMTRAPITLLTGEVGAGKTTLLQHLLDTMEERDARIGLVSNAQGDQDQLLRWILHAFDQPAVTDLGYVELFDRIQAFLLAEYAAGHRVVLVFDEAQHLSRDVLEELRMLTNINSRSDEILQLILVGQPELRDVVRRPDLKQFAQRVAVAYHLKALTAGDVATYVDHRVRVAGGPDGLFEPAACRLIHARTGGVPRLINQLCDLSLLYGFTEGADRISEGTVRKVLEDGVFFGGGGLAEPAARPPLRLVNPTKTPGEGGDG